jgi:Rieske Fe-S protein
VTTHDHLVDKIIKNVNPNITKIFGNTEFNTQVTLSNKISLQESKNISNYHNISTIQEDCIDKLKSEYNIYSDILIVKSQDKIYKNNSFIYVINTNYYNPITKQKLDNTKCNQIRYEVKIPIPFSTKEKEIITQLKDQGIDVFNKSDLAFKTSCVSYIDPQTDYDTTLNYRINKFLSNTTDCSNNGCSYNHYNTDGFINCDCYGGTFEQHNTDIELNYTSKSVLECVGEADVKIF